MEEQKVVKKSSAPIYIIIFAILLIAAGAVLIFTGNNKSFWDKKEPKEEEKDKPDDKTPNKGLVPTVITDEDALYYIEQHKKAVGKEFAWEAKNAKIIGHDENYEKYLVVFDEVGTDGTVVSKQTIISLLPDEKWVELPGWVEGERDLTVYNFIMNSISGEASIEIETPELEDYEYSGPSLDE